MAVASGFHLLVLHESAILTVWDFDGRCIVATLNWTEVNDVEAADIACAAWCSRDADEVITGHDSGAICRWGIVASGFELLQTYQVRCAALHLHVPLAVPAIVWSIPGHLTSINRNGDCVRSHHVLPGTQLQQAGD
jgi:hypothetical protein